jgi:hypothetical protein
MAFLAGLIPSVLGAVGKAGGVKFGAKKKSRRRRARLTASELAELSQIKSILGRTAAANALPFYMGRGR